MSQGCRPKPTPLPPGWQQLHCPGGQSAPRSATIVQDHTFVNKPRDQFKPFHSRKQRWSALVCHRRAGKTVATLNDLIRGAVNECKHEGRVGRA